MIDMQKIDTINRPQLIWCSDRTSIRMSGTIAGTQGIWRSPADSGAPQRLTMNETGITEVRLSENGTRLAFTKSPSRPREVWAYHLSGTVRRIKN
jgi:Tol biopolymer transport system component